MTDSDSDVSLGDAVTHPGRWPSERIRLLIQLRLEMEAQFRNGRSRHLLWPQIYNKLRATDPAMTETLKNVQKKFNNLMLTYKRIKSSSRTLNQSRWEFFDDFNEILSQFGETPDEPDRANVRYVKVEKDDDSVSFSSDDCDAPSSYRNVVAYKPKSPIKPAAVMEEPAANGVKSERFSVVHVKEPVRETRKRKSNDSASPLREQKKSKKSTAATTAELNDDDDDSSWFREYVKLSERNEQIRYEQHEQLLELERKRIEIETNNGQMLRELVDVVKKFVNK